MQLKHQLADDRVREEMREGKPPRRGTEMKRLRLVYETYPNATDAHGGDVLEAEYAKDIWDARKFSFLHFQPGKSIIWLDFTKVVDPFQGLAKEYIRFLMPGGSMALCYAQLRFLGFFLRFYHERCPEATDFRALSRADVEGYLTYTRESIMDNGNSATPGYVADRIRAVKRLLDFIVRVHPEIGPRTPMGHLFWPNDAPRTQWRATSDEIKFIPEYVIQQLDAKMHTLQGLLFPFVTIMRATGMRPSDILNLRHDRCLERTDSGWWLCGELPKTRTSNHRVPITDQVVSVIIAQRDRVLARYSDERNPGSYLFPAGLSTKRTGAMTHGPLLRAFTQWARANGIQDETGAPYPITFRALRHTRAVELINNGVSLVSVQKLLGHASPEMTLVYAKLLDPTVRREWEAALAQGAVRISPEGIPHSMAVTQIEDEEHLELEYIRHHLDNVRLPMGYCFRPQKATECPAQAIPCHTCVNFCTTAEFLPQLKAQREATLIQIDLGQRAKQGRWVERNQQSLQTLQPIIDLLEQGKLHQPLGKLVREYNPEEREKMKPQDGGPE